MEDVEQRGQPLDAVGAIALAEGSVAAFALTTLGDSLAFPERNAFGEVVMVQREEDPRALLRRAAELTAGGCRVAVLARARELAVAREVMEGIARQRLGLVVHALADAGGAEAFALADTGWGMLWSGGVLDSLDLALIARRAAEDCGTPFIVVHETEGVRVTEPVLPPGPALAQTYIGPAPSRIKKRTDVAHPTHADVSPRAFGERVPFALGSAMRELEALTGRRHDLIERVPVAETQLVLLGLGRTGEPLLAEVERLRAAGHDVGAVRVTALRPFPGPRLVKALARALAVTVVETCDLPLAQSNPLAREIKAAFADALTWAPDYPGVGRIPRILSGVVATAACELDSSDVDAAAENMLADERGKRHFVIGAPAAHSLPKGASAPAPRGPLTFRGRVADAVTAAACADVCAAVVHAVLGLQVRAAVRELTAAEGTGFAVDVLTGRERLRGAHVPHALRIIALDDPAALLKGNPIARLAGNGVLAVPTAQRDPERIWAALPPYAKALVHDRRARVVGWSPPASDGAGDARWLLAGAFAGLAVSDATDGARAAGDPASVAREAFRALRQLPNGPDEATASRAAEACRQAYEGSVEVPRALIGRDDEAVRLGRRDARCGVPPR